MSASDKDSRVHNIDEPRVWLDDGVLFIEFGGCSRITLAVAEQANRLHRALCPDRASLLLLQGERVARIEHAAQRFASTAAVRDVTAAMAIVARSFLPRHVTRMFLMYHRPPYPVQVFSDEVQARAWLLRQNVSLP